MIHIACAVLSILGFAIRGILMMRDSPLMRARWIRIVPHVVDTTLLGSAVWIALKYGFTLENSPWLSAKIVGLMIYIGLGFVALRLGKSKRVRIAAWVAALLVFGYIVAVAVDKSPLPFLT